MQQVQELAMQDDVPGLTELLAEWPEQNLEWLLCVQSRLGAPSSNAEQKQQLSQVIEEALQRNPALEIELAEEISRLDKLIAQSNEPKPSRPSKIKKQVEFSEEDQKNYDLLERLQGYEDWQFNELVNDINSLDYENLVPAVQHKVNQIVNLLHSLGQHKKLNPEILNSETYKQWHRDYAPESILQDKEFSNEKLLRLNALARSVSSIFKREYDNYLIERGDDPDEGVFGVPSSAAESKIDLSAIKVFEEKHQISLPEDLKTYYLNTPPDEKRGYLESIMHLSELDHNLSNEREWYEKLKGLGVINWLNYIWSNETIAFSVEEQVITQQHIDTLNSQYTGVGVLSVDDETYILIYFDAEHRFGAIWYSQDNPTKIYDNYLDVMLEKSPAQHTLFQLLGAIPQVLDRGNVEEHESREQFVDDLRKLD